MQCKLLCNTDNTPKTLEKFQYKDKNEISITWLDDIKQLPKSESVHYFLANEFFDALPIHKFQVPKTIKKKTNLSNNKQFFKKVNGVHKEIVVDYDEKTDKLKFAISPKVTAISKLLYNV